MIFLKQSTASQEIPLGFFLDSTDGNTEETGLTIANTDIKLWKAGATTLANKNSGGATHISNGLYYAVLDATDTDTLGSLVIFVHVAGALAVRVDCVVLAANIYDSLIGGGDVLDVSVTQFGGTNGTFSGGRPEVNTTHAAGTAWGSGAITAASIAADAITAAKIAADVTTEIQSGLATAAALSAVESKIDTIDDFLDTEIAAIKAKTDSLTFTGAGRVDANIEAVNNDTAAADSLARSAATIVRGTVDAGASTTSIPTSSLAPAASVADQFKGRIVIFDKDTSTAALRGQATDITASDGAGTLTVTALTTAPSSGDTFVIV